MISSHDVGAWWFHLIPRLQGDFFLRRATLGSVNGGGGGGARTVHFGARSIFLMLVPYPAPRAPAPALPPPEWQYEAVADPEGRHLGVSVPVCRRFSYDTITDGHKTYESVYNYL